MLFLKISYKHYKPYLGVNNVYMSINKDLDKKCKAPENINPF